MAKMIIGVISDKDMAEHAVEELQSYGFSAKDISIVMRDQERAREIHHDTGASVAEGAMTGVTAGGILGGLAGLMLGIGAIAIPGIGAVLIGGPLAAALGLTGAAATTVSGAFTGALAGGLVGSLVGLGVPEEDARYYETQVKDGAILVAVPVDYENEVEAKNILEDHNATQIRTVGESEPLRRRASKYEDDYRYMGAKGGEVSDEEVDEPLDDEGKGWKNS